MRILLPETIELCHEIAEEVAGDAPARQTIFLDDFARVLLAELLRDGVAVEYAFWFLRAIRAEISTRLSLMSS